MFYNRLLLKLAFLMVTFALNGEETTEKKTNILVFPANKIHNGDYFAFSETVEISGTITGDLYVAGAQVFIDGNIQGDILLAAGSAEISGAVGGNVRALGGQVLITGSIGKNATIVSGNGSFSNAALVNGNVVCITGNGDIGAKIGGSATAVASNLRISNTLGGNITAYVGDLRITSKAAIGGDLDYTSRNNASIDPRAVIGGKVLHHVSAVQDFIKGKWLHGFLVGSKVAALLMNFFYTFVIGIVLIRFFPQQIETAIEVLSRQPWKALGVGLMLLILVPLASLILLMTVLGAPFALTLIALNVIGFYTAKLFSIMWVSNRYAPKIGLKPNRILTLCVGLILYFVITAIPLFGFIISLAAMLLGLGAGVIGQLHKAKASRIF